MKYLIAVITEKGHNNIGMVIGNTKIGKCKGMDKLTFIEAIKNTTCFTFEVKEIQLNYESHRQYLNDLYPSASCYK